MIQGERTGKRNYGARLAVLGTVLCLLLTGCKDSEIIFSEETESESLIEPTQPESQQESENLISAPPLRFQDVLSSTWKEYEVTSGNYSWNYMAQGQMASVIACGNHPLEEGKIKEPITLPRYNRMDSVPYEVSCIRRPARIRVEEYSADALENTEAEMLSSEIYEESFILPLKPNRVYALTAEWDQADLEKNGCYGSAGYVLVTK